MDQSVYCWGRTGDRINWMRGGGGRGVGIHSEVSGVVVWANCSSLIWGLSEEEQLGKLIWGVESILGCGKCVMPERTFGVHL